MGQRKPKLKVASTKKLGAGDSAALRPWFESAGGRHDDRLPALWNALSLDLRHVDYLPPTRAEYKNALLTHCYVMVEAAFHAFAKGEGYKTFVHKRKDGSHWWLRHPDSGRILDPSWPQIDGPYPYHLGKPQALVPPTPSKRARELLARARRKAQGDY